MGKIGEFLNNKPWHPSSRQNQTLLFEAEERQREEQQRLEERQEELKQERAREELDALLPNRGGAKPAGIDLCTRLPRARTPKARRRAPARPTRPPWRLKPDGSRRRGGKGRARAGCRKGTGAGATGAGAGAPSAFIKDF